MDVSPDDRGQWTSKIGFILAAAGSAIGLGNIWRFPYVVGENGGGAFVIIYLLCIAFICLPYLLGELALGRFSHRNPVGAIKAVSQNKSWSIIGALCVLTGLCILSYYAVVAGWIFGYIFKMAAGRTADFGAYISNLYIVIPLFCLFILFTVGVVLGGIEHGIERWTKVLMPVLLVLMGLVIIRSITLEGASKGLEFYLSPNFSKITTQTVLAAMGQAFFSLSLGMGAMVTYGSYLPKDESILSSGIYVAIFDTGIALMAGFMIFPALFAIGQSPAAGPDLIFSVLPQVFGQLPFGVVIGTLFFILLSVAALTSTISLLEVPVSYLVDEKSWTRSQAVWTLGGIVFVLGLPSALSQGAVPALGNIAGGMGFLGIMDYIWGNVALALGAFLLSLFIGWAWTSGEAANEVEQGAPSFRNYRAIWGFFLRYICPLVIAAVLLSRAVNL